MRNILVAIFLVSTFACYVLAGNDYYWGEISPNDYIISRQTIKKTFVLGLKVTQKYVFKQNDNLNAYTITAIKVIDQKKKDGAVAELTSGGPGSKGATITFTSERGVGIHDIVEIYGR